MSDSGVAVIAGAILFAIWWSQQQPNAAADSNGSEPQTPPDTQLANKGAFPDSNSGGLTGFDDPSAADAFRTTASINADESKPLYQPLNKGAAPPNDNGAPQTDSNPTGPFGAFQPLVDLFTYPPVAALEAGGLAYKGTKALLGTPDFAAGTRNLQPESTDITTPEKRQTLESQEADEARRVQAERTRNVAELSGSSQAPAQPERAALPERPTGEGVQTPAERITTGQPPLTDHADVATGLRSGAGTPTLYGGPTMAPEAPALAPAGRTPLTLGGSSAPGEALALPEPAQVSQPRTFADVAAETPRLPEAVTVAQASPQALAERYFAGDITAANEARTLAQSQVLLERGNSAISTPSRRSLTQLVTTDIQAAQVEAPKARTELIGAGVSAEPSYAIAEPAGFGRIVEARRSNIFGTVEQVRDVRTHVDEHGELYANAEDISPPRIEISLGSGKVAAGAIAGKVGVGLLEAVTSAENVGLTFAAQDRDLAPNVTRETSYQGGVRTDVQTTTREAYTDRFGFIHSSNGGLESLLSFEIPSHIGFGSNAPPAPTPAPTPSISADRAAAARDAARAASAAARTPTPAITPNVRAIAAPGSQGMPAQQRPTYGSSRTNTATRRLNQE